ncbi:ABC transporter permease [Desulfatibacillum aliphaticivorans]|uniref:ABC transporter permease n=1 Tax=Desulfatibacillum aliphaticivorans TaxID=218208 RepID=UPI00041423F5|nr:ABC transporter permease [Desulfatibacillum aliphaticivorans]
MKAFWALFTARNKEFYRDRAGLFWNIAFPFLIIAGFAAIFGRGAEPTYKMGIVPSQGEVLSYELPAQVEDSPFFSKVEMPDKDEALEKLAEHRLDIAVQAGTEPLSYWVSDTSPKGAIAGDILEAAAADPEVLKNYTARQTIEGFQVDYIDWLFPGILGMNMMFSALFGVGFVVVRYRKNNVLKRLAATPLSAFQFLSAHVVSRLLVIMFSTLLVYIACVLMFGFQCKGSYLALITVFMLGGASHVSLAMVIASRGSNEEFASGLLNLLSWPMMFLSEVWFSIEGAPGWVKGISQVLPLTHVTSGMREVMSYGGGFAEILPQILILALITTVFMALGSWMFKWTG